MGFQPQNHQGRALGLVFLIAPTVTWLACSSPSTSGDCGECAAGQVCIGGQCHNVCSHDSNCGPCQRCKNEICEDLAVCTDDGPPAGDPNSGDSNSGDSHVGDTHVGDTHVGDAQVGDTHAGDTHVGDTHVGDTQSASVAIASIRVWGDAVLGGGSYWLEWHHTDSNGNDLGTISAQLGQNLYGSIDWTANITTPLVSGDYFALGGNEGSSDLTRNFTFIDADGALIDAVTISNVGSADIVTRFFSGEAYTRFHYSAGTITTSQQTVP